LLRGQWTIPLPWIYDAKLTLKMSQIRFDQAQVSAMDRKCNFIFSRPAFESVYTSDEEQVQYTQAFLKAFSDEESRLL
jgi:hypothetical protein